MGSSPLETAQAAARANTISTPRAPSSEDRPGLLEVGKAGDPVVIASDLFGGSAERIPELPST